MDAPRAAATEYWNLVAPLSISTLYLATNQTYRGHCQLMFDGRHACRSDQLTRDEWRAFSDDLFSECAFVGPPQHDRAEVVSRPQLTREFGQPIGRPPLVRPGRARIDDSEVVDALRSQGLKGR